jgi:hypothetical protein
VQEFTGASQAAFLGDSPEVEEMMVVKDVGDISIIGTLYSLLCISKTAML